MQVFHSLVNLPVLVCPVPTAEAPAAPQVLFRRPSCSRIK
ncbi:rCG58637 [Rattus norvegicus]|uniref:RCG58637 n=1 Tax=Rattus norvegicus TaxID=10116 RepID=A6MGS8_RAT|nr:rCG58637 [Rattus norvegicus]